VIQELLKKLDPDSRLPLGFEAKSFNHAIGGTSDLKQQMTQLIQLGFNSRRGIEVHLLRGKRLRL